MSTVKMLENLSKYFTKDATICWFDSDERFTVPEYIRATCEYPGNWKYIIDRIEEMKQGIMTAVRISSGDVAFQVVSFITLKAELIVQLDEYFVSYEEIPKWRKDLNLGRNIQR